LAENGQRRTQRLGFLGRMGETRQRALAALDRSPLAKTVGGTAALQLGNGLGVLRGAVHSIQGIVQGADFLGRLADPSDIIRSRPGEAAVSQLLDAGVAATRYGAQSIAQPSRVVDDLRKKAHEMRIALDPMATPPAKTFTGELKRNLAIGQNQGEMAFDIGSLAFGGAAVKGLKGVAAVPEAVAIAKFTKQGHSSLAARELGSGLIAS